MQNSPLFLIPQVSSLSRKLSRRHLVRAPRWRSKCGWTFMAFSVYPVPPWLKFRKLMRQKSPWRRSRPMKKMNRFGPTNHLSFPLWKQEYCTCTAAVFMVGHICSLEQDADWSGWAAESGRQSKRTWRKAMWEWRNGGKKFSFVFQMKAKYSSPSPLIRWLSQPSRNFFYNALSSCVSIVLWFDFWIESWIFLDHHRGGQGREKIWSAAPSQKA